MKIACMMTVWNEIDIIPYKVAFCKKNNLVPYIIDNYSDDGTWEWLNDNKIKTHRIDTNGMFLLRPLQNEIVNTLHRMDPKPDWCIYNGCDLFPVAVNNNLHDELVRIDSNNCNYAKIMNCDLYNTGEDVPDRSGKSLFNNYFYRSRPKPFVMIHKYSPKLRYQGDRVHILDDTQRIGDITGLQINYGNVKTKEERDATLARRQKAWENGEHKIHGSHYRVGKEKNWLWDKNTLLDIRESEDFQYVKFLQQLDPYEYTG